MKVMKKVFILSFLIILTSCHSKWEGRKNGIRYYKKYTCIDSHFELRHSFVLVGKVIVPTSYNHEVCDKYKLDTIWEKQVK
jgi:hypothetical protein